MTPKLNTEGPSPEALTWLLTFAVNVTVLYKLTSAKTPCLPKMLLLVADMASGTKRLDAESTFKMLSMLGKKNWQLS